MSVAIFDQGAKETPAFSSSSTAELRRSKKRRGLRSVPPAASTYDLSGLYSEHYRSMVKLASMYVDTKEAAEEVVQDAFVKLVAGNYQIEPAKEGAYLRRMVLNGAHSKLRKRRVRRLHTPEQPGLVAAAEVSGVARSERDDMLTALRKLPEKQAAVLILRYYLDLSEADIAETLGIAPGSVKSHAHRGLKKLEITLGVDRSDTAPGESK